MSLFYKARQFDTTDNFGDFKSKKYMSFTKSPA